MGGMPRCALLVIVLGCGPRVGDAGAEHSGETTGAGTTTSTQSSDVGTATSATTTSATSTATTSTTTTGTTTTSTGDETTSSTSTDGGSDPTVGFILDPDGGCVSSQCDVWGQDCPDGEKCVPWSGGGDGPGDGCAQSRCSRLADDPRAPGESCIAEEAPWSGLDDCELGAYCWQVDELTLEGVCVAQCENSEANPTCADPAMSCFILDDTAVTACVPECDPLAPACASGSTCVLAEANDQAPVCVPLELGLPSGEGTACEWPNGCGGGFACVDGASVSGCDASHCCATLCDLDAPSCGEANPECLPLEGAPKGVGACSTGGA